jgi:tetrathionate reductase subunit B
MGGKELKYAMLIDTARCSVCFACQVACKDEFVGNKYLPYSFPQPDVEQEWIKIEEIERGKFPYVKVYPIPVLCMHCEKAPCIDACPVKGSIYKEENGAVIIDPVKCAPGKCKTKPCMEGCPYKVIFFNNDSNIAQKCTLCMHRLEEGKEPACADACPSGVYTFGEEADIIKEAKKRGAKELHPEFKAGPRIFYLGLPSVTLAGHVIDSKSFMDVPGAVITVSGGNGKIRTGKSDVSGNFVFEDLVLKGKYTVQIKCTGYKAATIDAVKIGNEYMHLGELKLAKS